LPTIAGFLQFSFDIGYRHWLRCFASRLGMPTIEIAREVLLFPGIAAEQRRQERFETGKISYIFATRNQSQYKILCHSIIVCGDLETLLAQIIKKIGQKLRIGPWRGVRYGLVLNHLFIAPPARSWSSAVLARLL